MSENLRNCRYLHSSALTFKKMVSSASFVDSCNESGTERRTGNRRSEMIEWGNYVASPPFLLHVIRFIRLFQRSWYDI